MEIKKNSNIKGIEFSLIYDDISMQLVRIEVLNKTEKTLHFDLISKNLSSSFDTDTSLSFKQKDRADWVWKEREIDKEMRISGIEWIAWAE